MFTECRHGAKLQRVFLTFSSGLLLQNVKIWLIVIVSIRLSYSKNKTVQFFETQCRFQGHDIMQRQITRR